MVREPYSYPRGAISIQNVLTGEHHQLLGTYFHVKPSFLLGSSKLLRWQKQKHDRQER